MAVCSSVAHRRSSMERNITSVRGCLAIGFVGLTGGCGGGEDHVVPAETITSKSGEVFERRFVDRDYPYTQPGATGDVCAEWEIVSRSGVVVDVQREWYPMNTMNRHLGNVGTPDAVAHVDAGFR